MLDFLFHLPLVGGVLALAALGLILMWAPFMGGGGEVSPEEIRAAQSKRCQVALVEYEKRRAQGLAAQRPAGC